MQKNYFDNPDLQSIDKSILNKIIEELFKPEIIYKAQAQIAIARQNWNKWNINFRLNFCEHLYTILYSSYFPKPLYRVTYDNSAFRGRFYSTKWQIGFPSAYIGKEVYNLENFIGVFLHESFHAFLFFLSICLNPVASYEVFRPPQSIMTFARKIKIHPKQNNLIKIAKKNFLGVLDEQTQFKDSYFLNVEILTENLAEALFYKLFPQKAYSRGYAREEQYINKRLLGYSPAQAKRVR